MINMSKYFHFPGWKTLYYDIIWSLFSAIIGSLCFSIFANLALMGNRTIYLELFFMGWLFGFLFSFIPTIVFGGALSFVFHSEPYISKKKTYLLGGIMGGLSAIVIDMGVLHFTSADLDIEIFIYALVAVIIAVVCGGWTARKIFNSTTSDLTEVTK